MIDASMEFTKSGSQTSLAPMTALENFRAQLGVSACTVWRWRRKGWLKTINICGRQYVTADAIADFTRRASSGEFAQDHKTPRCAR